MIVFSLICARRHEFEAWFRDGASFDAQQAKRAIACPECGNTKVEKAPMAPRLAPRREDGGRARKHTAVMGRQALLQLRRHVEQNCEYVGERFADEARKIHYEEAEKRDIYGEASDEDAKALAEEGVEFHRIPWPTREDS
jgi:hypothetical protein